MRRKETVFEYEINYPKALAEARKIGESVVKRHPEMDYNLFTVEGEGAQFPKVGQPVLRPTAVGRCTTSLLSTPAPSLAPNGSWVIHRRPLVPMTVRSAVDPPSTLGGKPVSEWVVCRWAVHPPSTLGGKLRATPGVYHQPIFENGT